MEFKVLFTVDYKLLDNKNKENIFFGLLKQQNIKSNVIVITCHNRLFDKKNTFFTLLPNTVYLSTLQRVKMKYQEENQIDVQIYEKKGQNTLT